MGRAPAPHTRRAPAPEGGAGGSEFEFNVCVLGRTMTLTELTARMRRHEIDPHDVALAEITSGFRARARGGGVAPAEIAAFLEQSSLAIRVKATLLLEGAGPVPAAPEEDEPPPPPSARVEEYRRFKAAADRLLEELGVGKPEEGPRSFAGPVVRTPQPVERLKVDTERLAGALGKVMARMAQKQALEMPIRTWSAEEKIVEIRGRLQADARLAFDLLVEQASSRMEAVAYFLAVLQLYRDGEIDILQDGPFGPVQLVRTGSAPPVASQAGAASEG